MLFNKSKNERDGQDKNYTELPLFLPQPDECNKPICIYLSLSFFFFHCSWFLESKASFMRSVVSQFNTNSGDAVICPNKFMTLLCNSHTWTM